MVGLARRAKPRSGRPPGGQGRGGGHPRSRSNQRAAALEAADAERADEISALKASLARSQAAAEAAQMLAEREGEARQAAEAAAAEMRSQIAEEAALHQRID